jgi:hypothetical protein
MLSTGVIAQTGFVRINAGEIRAIASVTGSNSAAAVKIAAGMGVDGKIELDGGVVLYSNCDGGGTKYDIYAAAGEVSIARAVVDWAKITSPTYIKNTQRSALARVLATDPKGGSPPSGSTGEIGFYGGKAYVCTAGPTTWQLITSA